MADCSASCLKFGGAEEFPLDKVVVREIVEIRDAVCIEGPFEWSSDDDVGTCANEKDACVLDRVRNLASKKQQLFEDRKLDAQKAGQPEKTEDLSGEGVPESSRRLCDFFRNVTKYLFFISQMREIILKRLKTNDEEMKLLGEKLQAFREERALLEKVTADEELETMLERMETSEGEGMFLEILEPTREDAVLMEALASLDPEKMALTENLESVRAEMVLLKNLEILIEGKIESEKSEDAKGEESGTAKPRKRTLEKWRLETVKEENGRLLQELETVEEENEMLLSQLEAIKERLDLFLQDIDPVVLYIDKAVRALLGGFESLTGVEKTLLERFRHLNGERKMLQEKLEPVNKEIKMLVGRMKLAVDKD